MGAMFIKTFIGFILPPVALSAVKHLINVIFIIVKPRLVAITPIRRTAVSQLRCARVIMYAVSASDNVRQCRTLISTQKPNHILNGDRVQAKLIGFYYCVSKFLVVLYQAIKLNPVTHKIPPITRRSEEYRLYQHLAHGTLPQRY